MEPLTFSQRLTLFFYSANNIAGCVLALGGLALFFTGVIQSYWLAIVAGLYGVGYLGWPRNELAKTAQHADLSSELVAEQVRKLVDSVAKGLPKDAFTVVETVRRYLPDTLAAYLRLPKLYAQTQFLGDGRTASQVLVDQLKVLDTSLKDVAKSAFAGDAEALITNGQFLETKFAEKAVFLRGR